MAEAAQDQNANRSQALRDSLRDPDRLGTQLPQPFNQPGASPLEATGQGPVGLSSALGGHR
jgi:hypothetical protein